MVILLRQSVAGQLHERVIPTVYRAPVKEARKKLESARNDRLREQRRIEKERKERKRVLVVLTNVTGGTWDKPTRGVNFVVFFTARDVTNEEFQQYANNVLTA